MPIQFACPSCGRQVAAPDTAAGVTGPCPYCRAQITAPAAPGQPATLAGTAPGRQPAPPAMPSPQTADPLPGGAPPAGNTAPGPGQAPPPGYGATQQGYGTNTPPAGGYGMPSAPGGNLDIGAILSQAWQVVTGNPGLVIGGFLIVALAYGVGYAMQFAIQMPAQAHGHPSIATQLLSSLFGLLVNLLLAPLALGPLYLIDQLLTRGQADFSALFLGYRRFFTIIGATLLIYAAVLAGTLALIIPGIIIGVALSLANMEIVDRDAGAVDALQASWQATAGYRLMIFVNLLVLGVISALGFAACGVGALLTMPIYFAGQVIIYRELRGLKGTPL